MNYYLAVDGGGSKTHVICTNEQGQVIGNGESGPTSLAATSVGAASFNLREAIRQATQGLEEGSQCLGLAMGLAGMDTPQEEETAKRVFSDTLVDKKLGKFILVNDIVIALESGTQNANAIALIAGTGSNCFGRNDQGQTAKVSGLDYILADQGSGYNIGSHVLKAVVKSFDGRGEKTVMERLVCEHFQISSVDELKGQVYNPPLTKTEVGELSKVCVLGLEQGDKVAEMIMEYEVQELFVMVKTVIDKLGLKDKQFDLVATGGICHLSYVKDNLHPMISQYAPQVSIIVPQKSPVYGALSLITRG